MNKQGTKLAIETLEAEKKRQYNLLDALPPKSRDRAIEITRMIQACEYGIFAMEQQLNSGWIPVDSMGLPDKGRYIVTTERGEEKESLFDLGKWWQIDNSTVSLAWLEEPFKIIAWQPLPPKYKKDGVVNG